MKLTMSESLKLFYPLVRNGFYFLLNIFFKNGAGFKKNILVVRTDKIGDFILFSPSFRYIKNKYPNHKIFFLGNKNVGDLAAKTFGIDEFIPLDIKKFQLNPFYYFEIFDKLRSGRFEIAIYPAYSRSFTGDELIRISGASTRICQIGDSSNLKEKQRQKNNLFYTDVVKSNYGAVTEIEKNKSFLQSLNIDIFDDFIPAVSISDADITTGLNILKKNGWLEKKYVVINPGAGLKYRIWPLARFSEVINWIQKNKGFEIVISGSKDELDLLSEIRKNVECPMINIMGETTLIELASILKGAVFYFGSDTGTLHLSSSVGTPSLCVMGGGHFGRFFPYGDLNRNRIIFDKNMKCKNDNWDCAKIKGFDNPAPCIDGVKVDDVIREINSLLVYLNIN